MNKATRLSQRSNAVVVWTTVQMTRIIDPRRAGGDVITADEWARLSPCALAPVIPTGTSFARPATVAPQGAPRRPGGPLDVEEAFGA